MEHSVYLVLITACSTLAATFVAAIFNARNMREVAKETLDREFRLRELDFRVAERKRNIEAFESAYVALCALQRGFSTTSMVMELDEKISVAEWDTKYTGLCQLADTARAKSVLLGTPSHTAVEDAYNEMSVYWGQFRLLISLSGDPEYYRPDFHPRKSAFEACNSAYSKLGSAKEIMVDVIRENAPRAQAVSAKP